MTTVFVLCPSGIIYTSAFHLRKRSMIRKFGGLSGFARFIHSYPSLLLTIPKSQTKYISDDFSKSRMNELLRNIDRQVHYRISPCLYSRSLMYFGPGT